ncbi:MAG TPA: flagellar basal-body MS-ring/collar protein FliF [Vitreimonas sp.]|uniref:flagellar basal-body MS-ring/collar protein FliF n=1 Tax=Vitreimonas sp. TaxID=3069702 RepID=UPI002D2F5393|nr:flagellar basal-body MS-ring/collar protein FliF [Vitreimonas sp.]HYD85987.1 flagellar basal-body MS-ring/collar protein FliF [Vitreimonas sp.]
MSDDAPSENPPRISPRTIALVFSVLLAALIGWYVLALRQDYAVLYSGLRPAQAAAIVTALEAEGVSYRLAAGGADILTPAGETDALRLRLSGSAGPAGGPDGFEIFNQSDMGLTDFAQKIRYQRAMQGELARTIMMMQGVAEARVHISMPERTLFRGERRNAEAAVTLVMQAGEPASGERVEGVQRLVAAAVPDLAASDVVVLNARGELISARIALVQAQGANPASAGLSPDHVSELIRIAIPNRRFDVRIEDLPPALEGGVEADAAGAGSRLITIATESSLTVEERARVRARFEGAGLIDGSSRQLLAFRVEPLAPDAYAPAPAGQTVAGAGESVQARAPAPAWPSLVAMIAAALALAACVAGLLIWRRMSRPRLTFEEHRQIAERLAASLDTAGALDGR